MIDVFVTPSFHEGRGPVRAKAAALQTATALMAAKPIRNPRRVADARETGILDLTGASE
jgi:hypothetical protein